MNRAEWHAVLDGHTAADSRESEYVVQMRALLSTVGDPFGRTHFDPGHFTASAFVLSPDHRDLLLIYHDKLERWLQPGGHIDATDESLLEAALRELWEETGLDFSVVEVTSPPVLDVDIHGIPANSRKGEPSHLHFDVRLLFVARTRAAIAGTDARAVRWVSLDKVHEVDTDDSVMRAVRKIVDRLPYLGEEMPEAR